jgi:hypothetical protein
MKFVMSGLHQRSFPERTMGMFKRSTVALAAAAVLGLGSSLQAQVFFQGSTSGCFNPVAGTCGGSPSVPGVSFSGDTFIGNTAPITNLYAVGGSAGQSFGSFTVGTGGEVYANLPFLLNISFLAPFGITPSAVYTATLLGSASSIAGGGFFIDFDNTVKTYTYTAPDGGGTFTLGVNDVSVTGGHTGFVSGNIIASPEPATLMLVGTGLLALVPVIRRRRAMVSE